MNQPSQEQTMPPTQNTETPQRPGPGRPPRVRSASAASCPEEIQIQAYREARVLRDEAEAAEMEAKTKQRAYRDYLRDAARRGVPVDLITDALDLRHEGSAALAAREAARLKLLEMSGLAPGIMDSLVEGHLRGNI